MVSMSTDTQAFEMRRCVEKDDATAMSAFSRVAQFETGGQHVLTYRECAGLYVIQSIFGRQVRSQIFEGSDDRQIDSWCAEIGQGLSFLELGSLSEAIEAAESHGYEVAAAMRRPKAITRLSVRRFGTETFEIDYDHALRVLLEPDAMTEGPQIFAAQ